MTGIRLTCPTNKALLTNSDGIADYNCSVLVKASDNLFPTFTDGCSSTALRYTITDAIGGTRNGLGTISGTTLYKGVTRVTYSLSFSGTETCSFDVTVNDNEAPKFPTLTNVILDACNLPASVNTHLTTPAVTDNCDAPGSITIAVVQDVTANLNCISGTTKYTKSITRTWSATDARGNMATKTQVLYIRDATAPMAVCKDITVNGITSNNVTVTAASLNNGSSDNCTLSSALTYAICRSSANCTFSSSVVLAASLIPSTANSVIIPVTIRVTDGCGNASTCNANVRLQRLNTTNKEEAPTNSEPTPLEERTPLTPASDVNTTHGSLKCYPNPFMDNLNLEYNLTKDVTNVVLKVYDNQGKLVTVSEQGGLFAGYYTMNWNLSELQAGMYHVCLEIDGKCSKVERVIVLK
jgi:Secretion system C-terminal sorting domain